MRDLHGLSISDVEATGVALGEARAVWTALQGLDCGREEPEVWRCLSKDILKPSHTFALHQLLLNACYANWDQGVKGPRPVWVPDLESSAFTNLAAFMKDMEWSSGNPLLDYPLLQRFSVDKPGIFWEKMLRRLHIRFHTQPSRILLSSPNPDGFVWLPGCKFNIAESALSRGDPDAPAITWAKEPNAYLIQSLTLHQLRRQCTRLAAALSRRFPPGSSIAINMPMTVTSVVAYLGIVLSGCVVVSIADSFSPPEVASRLKIAGAVAIMTQDVILRGGKTFALFSRVVEANAPMAIVCPGLGDNLQVNLREGDMEYSEFLASGGPLGQFQPYSADGYEATNILFSSGTTGEPKAIPYTHLTPIRCAVDGFAHQDIRHRDVVCWPTNLGWMMGPWLVYAALLNGATIALFEGSPLGREFCQFVSAARVTQLGVVPSIVRAWREGASVKGIDWASIRCFSSTGEASTPEEYHWLMAQAGYKPVIEYCGGTEIGGGFLSGSLLQPQCPSTFSTPTLGASIALILDSGAQSLHGDPRPATGELALVSPMLGNSQKLLNRDHFLVYYDGMPMLEGTSMPLRRHGDEVERLPGGYYCAHGRCDDTMNLGGIKVSSIELERAVMANVQQVKEAAAVGVTPSGSGPQKLVLFLVPKAAGHQPGASKFRELCQKAVRTELNPLFKVADVVLCESLPRTASNKIMRRLLRSRYGKGRSRL